MHWLVPTRLPFEMLGLAVISAWISSRAALWGSLLGASIAAALYAGIMNGPALAESALAGAAVYGYYRVPASCATKCGLAMVMAALLLGLFGHYLPGFQEHALLTDTVLSPGAYPTSIVWNFDKPLAGLLLIGWGINRIHSWRSWANILPTAFVFYGACVALMAAGALALRAIRWAPHVDHTTGLFALTNLLFVCVPEEAFFRGFVQRKLSDAFAGLSRGPYWSVGVASIIFGICHFAGGLGLMFVATVAGVFYGLAYQKTGSIEASVLVHFLLNFSHFTLFTYPALKR